MCSLGFIVLATVCAGLVHAGDLPGVLSEQRARFNYMLHCQGCHLPGGTGTVDGTVPNMLGFVGRFLHVGGGREFLVQVPGSANAPLDDDKLAELLNWVLNTMSPSELPEGFQPYTPTEVGELRKSPLAEIVETRKALVATMEDSAKY